MVMHPRRVPIPRVAVIGAGISGLISARTLHELGLDVTVFEKSPGLGGRTATRRADPGQSFDHGAQYFTARDPQFIRHVEAWIEAAREAFFTVLVETDRSFVISAGRKLPITPGMMTDTQIITGRKSILSYLMKPFLKARSDALRER